MQGFNMGRYVPPEHEGTTTGNALNKKHPLGARASKLASRGELTVRFEMPFAVWCTTCKPSPNPVLIGQGVRFNAAKRRVGSYHSTPIYAFRMRHPPCGGTIEIRTDPANTAYVVTEGGRRRDTGDEDGRHDGDSLVPSGHVPLEGFRIETEAERAAARSGAFARLEKTIADRAALASAGRRIDELAAASSQQWEDPFARNQRLRRAFRAGRRAREADAAAGEALADRMGLGIDLLPATEQDAARAALVDFGVGADADAEGDGAVSRALAGPLFGGSGGPGKSEGERRRDSVPRATRTKKAPVEGKKTGKAAAAKRKAEDAVASKRLALATEIVGNTRAARDPFLVSTAKEKTGVATPRLPGLKRKRSSQEAPGPPESEITGKSTVSGLALVDYDSASE